jgi:hypothetical protein
MLRKVTRHADAVAANVEAVDEGAQLALVQVEDPPRVRVRVRVIG